MEKLPLKQTKQDQPSNKRTTLLFQVLHATKWKFLFSQKLKVNMIKVNPTDNGAGVMISGDYNDLVSMRESITDSLSHVDFTDAMENQLLGLSYDLRHAFQGRRDLIDDAGSLNLLDGNMPIKYYGFKIVWPTFLFQLSIMKNISKSISSKRILADFMRLETSTEEALILFDENIGNLCIQELNNLGDYPDDYLLTFVDMQSYDYIHDNKTAKKRFKKLPNILASFSHRSSDYGEAKAFMQIKAAELDSNIHDLIDQREWLDIRW